MPFLTQANIKYSCCALLTAINARRFLDGSPYAQPGTPKFEDLVDLAGCRYGGAVSIEKAWDRLCLHRQTGPQNLPWIRGRLLEGRPVGLSAFSPKYGYHSTLCVGVSDDSVCLVNWKERAPVTEVLWSDLEAPVDVQAVAFSLGRLC